MAKLTDVCDIQYGYAFDSGYFTDNNAYPQLVRIRDVKRGFSETYYNGEYPEEYVLKSGDLLVGMDGEFNIARWKVDGALLNQRVCKIVARPDTDEEYLRFILGKALKTIEDRTSFATVKHLSARELNKLELDMPQYEEQVHRSTVLSKLEDVIEQRRNELDKLDELIKARFVEMFGNETNRVKLINLCKFINGDRGKNYPSGTDIVEEGIPFINAGHLNQNRIDFEDMNYITEERYELLNSGKVQKDDILYCLRGSLGKKALVHIEKGAIASSLVILRPNVEMIIPSFLLYSLEQPYILEQMKKANNGSSQPNLSAQSVKEYEVILPKIEQQQDFDDFVQQVDKSKVVKDNINE